MTLFRGLPAHPGKGQWLWGPFPGLSLGTSYVPVPTARGSPVCTQGSAERLGCAGTLYLLRIVGAFSPRAGSVSEKLLSFPFYGLSHRGTPR